MISRKVFDGSAFAKGFGEIFDDRTIKKPGNQDLAIASEGSDGGPRPAKVAKSREIHVMFREQGRTENPHVEVTDEGHVEALVDDTRVWYNPESAV